jgi:hypothetical protein
MTDNFIQLIFYCVIVTFTPLLARQCNRSFFAVQLFQQTKAENTKMSRSTTILLQNQPEAVFILFLTTFQSFNNHESPLQYPLDSFPSIELLCL